MKYLFSFFCLTFLFLSSPSLHAQSELPEWKKLRYLSEEEMHLEVTTALGFEETDPPVGPIRNVAEFDPMQAVLVRYPFGVPVKLMEEISKDVEVITIVENENQENIVKSIYEGNNVNLENCSFMHAPTNSWWVRDYGPWFVFDGDLNPGIMDFPYNRPRPKDNAIPAAVAEYLGIDLYGMNILHTGGNYMTDGLGISSSTDLIVEENPAMTEEEINGLLKDYLAIDNYYVLEDPLDDYIKHIDCWGKFLTPGKVIIGQVAESDYRYEDYEAAASFFENTLSAYGKPYEVFRVYTPGGNPATPYTNSLIVNDKIFVPLSGNSLDDEAITAYEQAMPGYQIIGIPHNGWYNTDALHCRAKGIADLGMLYIEHKPVLGWNAYSPSIEINANFISYNQSNIAPGDAVLHYRINQEAYQTSMFEEQENGEWTATFTNLEPGDEVDYYIKVQDQSGREIKHPYIGVSDPHEFNLTYFTNDLVLNPDTLIFSNVADMTNGLPVKMINQSFTDIEIAEIILPESQDFTIAISNIPVLPILLYGGEELALNVALINDLPNPNTYFEAEIIFKSLQSEYKLPLIIQRDQDTRVSGIDPVSQLKVFPNPSSDILTFSFKLEKTQEVILEIYNEQGQLISKMKEVMLPGEQNMTYSFGKDYKSSTGGKYYYILYLDKIIKRGVIVND